jgi:hypothetical protein
MPLSAAVGIAHAASILPRKLNSGFAPLNPSAPNWGQICLEIGSFEPSTRSIVRTPKSDGKKSRAVVIQLAQGLAQFRVPS